MSSIKRARKRISEGTGFDDAPAKRLASRAMCDAVVKFAAADSFGRGSGEAGRNALEDLDALLADTGARRGIAYLPEDGDATCVGTPLYVAAEVDAPLAAEALLKHGASMAQAFRGVSAIQVAIHRGSKATLDVFLGRLRALEARAHGDGGADALRESQMARRDESDCESDEARENRIFDLYEAALSGKPLPNDKRKPLQHDDKRDARYDDSTESESESDDDGRGRRQREERGGDGASQTGSNGALLTGGGALHVEEESSESESESESSDGGLAGDADNVARRPKGPPKPRLRRQWTHTTIAGRAERRLHRNTDSGPISEGAGSSRGWTAAKTHARPRPTSKRKRGLMTVTL
ncbi:hypothetical protein M885DRAFT_511194 [Pelagophyceae sp. CCMP2097]|nr:hypothetical protein M885DRAFT_511194 [Pelagophyceae sp. CCMP2097]